MRHRLGGEVQGACPVLSGDGDRTVAISIPVPVSIDRRENYSSPFSSTAGHGRHSKNDSQWMNAWVAHFPSFTAAKFIVAFSGSCLFFVSLNTRRGAAMMNHTTWEFWHLHVRKRTYTWYETVHAWSLQVLMLPKSRNQQPGTFVFFKTHLGNSPAVPSRNLPPSLILLFIS